ncbi:MAG: ABC transporter substrate-binding protein, partial [Proteobacteria bacterium]|nr:ABC transporter substrate-binding protein [Pseudomonadota bacterium]
LVLLLAGTLVAAAASAQTVQQPRRLGVLLIAEDCPTPAPLVESLARLGWVDGRTIAFDCASANGRFDQAAPLAAALIARHPDLLVGRTLLAARPFKALTATIPIVMLGVADPVDQGLVDSLARPGGNMTGLVSILFEVESKRIELLRELVPRFARLAVVAPRVGRDSIYEKTIDQLLERAAAAHGFTYQWFSTDYGNDIPDVFAAIAAQRFDAVSLVSAPFTREQVGRLGQAARRGGVPTIGNLAELADAGVLLTYGASSDHVARRGAVYVDKILRGAKPADLPFEQPSEFDLAINQATATTLGLTIPPALLARATMVIE